MEPEPVVRVVDVCVQAAGQCLEALPFVAAEGLARGDRGAELVDQLRHHMVGHGRHGSPPSSVTSNEACGTARAIP